MGDHGVDVGAEQDILRRHPTGPKDRYFAVTEFRRVAPVRLIDISDADRLRVADLERRAMGAREAAGRPAGIGGWIKLAKGRR